MTDRLRAVPNMNVPLVGAGAQPQQQAIVVDTFDPQGNPIKALYPAVAVGVLSDQALGQIVQSVVGTALFELARRGSIPGTADRAVVAIERIHQVRTDYPDDFEQQAKLVGQILDEYHNPPTEAAPEQPAEVTT